MTTSLRTFQWVAGAILESLTEAGDTWAGGLHSAWFDPMAIPSGAERITGRGGVLERERLTVVISGTALDLPDHRQQAIEACLRAGMFPDVMEAMPASDEQALAASLNLVDGADIYVGIYAFRYGQPPQGNWKSITHLEYERALEREIPTLAFLIHPVHPVRREDVETGRSDGTDAVVVRAGRWPGRCLFEVAGGSARAHRGRTQPAPPRGGSQEDQPSSARLHYVSDIPAPPDWYVAHPNTLLQTKGLIRRRSELERLTPIFLG